MTPFAPNLTAFSSSVFNERDDSINNNYNIQNNSQNNSHSHIINHHHHGQHSNDRPHPTLNGGSDIRAGNKRRNAPPSTMPAASSSGSVGAPPSPTTTSSSSSSSFDARRLQSPSTHEALLRLHDNEILLLDSVKKFASQKMISLYFAFGEMSINFLNQLQKQKFTFRANFLATWLLFYGARNSKNSCEAKGTVAKTP